MGIDPPLQDVLANVLWQGWFNPAPAMLALSPRQSIAREVRGQKFDQRPDSRRQATPDRVPHRKLQGDWGSRTADNQG
jgi:hypothetical protein